MKYLAIGLIAVVLTFSWAAFHVGSEIGEARGERDRRTAEYERHAEEQIRSTCLSGQSGNIAECVSKIIRTTNEDSRAESNLIAQTEMARWALYMLLTTAGMAVITGAGVYYVWRTLSVTREIGEKQVKAYLSITVVTVSVELAIMDRGEVAVWNLSVAIKNSGQSPARNVLLSIKNTQSGSDNGETSIGDISSGEEVPVTYMLPASVDVAKARGGKGNDFGTDISIWLSYRDIFDRTEEIGPIEYMILGDVADPKRNQSIKVRTNRRTVTQVKIDGGKEG